MKKNIIILTLFFITNYTFAQWQRTNGPYGTPVKCFAVSGNTLFAGGDGGVFKTTSNGVTWDYINAMGNLILPYDGNENITDFLLDGSNLYAATLWNGIFKSTDNGVTWAPVNTGLGNISVYKLFKFGTDLYAGTSTEVYKSTNNGASWSSSSIGIPSSVVTSFASIGTNLFAGTSTGAYISSNNGLTWSPINTTIGSSRTLLGSIGTNLFAGTNNGIFMSSNNGISWSNVSSNLPAVSTTTLNYIKSLSVVGGTIFVSKNKATFSNSGLYKSNNNGTSWTDCNTGIIGLDGVNFQYINSVSSFGANLVLGSDLGVHISYDGGNTWQSLGLGLTNQTNCLKVKGSEIYCGTNNGLYVTSNSGATWNSINNGLSSNAQVKSFCFNGSTLFAAIPGNLFYPSKGVYISNNNGSSWVQSNNGLTNLKVNCVAAFGGTVFAGTSTGLFTSTNNGANWFPSNTGLAANSNISVIHYNSPVLFIITNHGVYMSTNNGANWAYSSVGGSSKCFENDGTSIYTGGSYGAFKSTNYGTSWTQLNLGVGVPDIVSMLQTNNFLLAAKNGNGPIISYTGGGNWTTAMDNNLQNFNGVALAANSSDIFLGTFYSTSGNARDINGVWRRGIGTFTGIKNYDISKNIKLYPNPANNYLNILIDGEVIESVSIIDLLGKESIYNLNENMIDISGLLSGSYALKIILKGKANPYHTKFIKLN